MFFQSVVLHFVSSKVFEVVFFSGQGLHTKICQIAVGEHGSFRKREIVSQGVQ